MIAKQNLQNIFKNERARSFVFWCGSLIVIDQLLKFLVFKLTPETAMLQVGNLYVIGLKHYQNINFAFSLPVPYILMYLIYTVALVAMVWYVAKNYQHLSRVHLYSWALIFAGALSNVGERIWLGYVRDFLYIAGGSILNLADFYIIMGVIVLLLVQNKSKNL